jgi:hypothetical protein
MPQYLARCSSPLWRGGARPSAIFGLPNNYLITER